MRNIIILSFAVAIIVFSCKSSGQKEKIPIARVNKKYLYYNDIQGIIPPNTPKKDSIAIIKDYINKWIKRQVIIEKAELNLPEKEKDVEELLENYRAALLSYKYQQEYLKQKLDTNVGDDELERYFNEHVSEFKLENSIVKATYIKIAKSAPRINQLKQWYVSENEKNQDLMADYCSQFANKFDEFKNEWINFNELITKLPVSIPEPEKFLKQNKKIEVADSAFLYLINIKSFKLKQELSPFEYVKNNIKKIILNNRRLKLLKNLEQDLYNSALSNKDVEIYK